MSYKNHVFIYKEPLNNYYSKINKTKPNINILWSKFIIMKRMSPVDFYIISSKF